MGLPRPDPDSLPELPPDRLTLDLVPRAGGPPPRPFASHPGTPVILVVDDDPDVSRFAAHVLGQAYTVYVADDAVRAASVLRAIPPPAVIVLDVMMPGVDGYALAKQIKAQPSLARVPLIFLTAKDSALDVIHGIQAGARHYLLKPLKLDELRRKVEHVVGPGLGAPAT